MFNPTVVFSMLIAFITVGLIFAYLMRLLALSALEIIDTQNLGEKYSQQCEYISSTSEHLYKLYPLYVGAIMMNGGLLASFTAGSDSSFLISILAATINASAIVNMYNVNSEHKRFREALKEIGVLRVEDDEDDD